jgi:hypothetical protein
MLSTLSDPHPHSLKGLAVIDDGDHVLHVAVWVLPIPQMLFFVQLGFIFVSATLTVLANGALQLSQEPS